MAIPDAARARDQQLSQRFHGKNGGEWHPYVRNNSANDNTWAWQLWAIRVEARRRMAARAIK